MAVRVLPRSPARSDDQVGALPALVLGLALLPGALDLLRVVQPALDQVLAAPVVVACGVTAVVLLLTWLRFPRTSWLVAASCAALASLALRLAGLEVAPVLSLLSVLALGVGGAFASGDANPSGA
jgi:hypothetical protein